MYMRMWMNGFARVSIAHRVCRFVTVEVFVWGKKWRLGMHDVHRNMNDDIDFYHDGAV